MAALGQIRGIQSIGIADHPDKTVYPGILPEFIAVIFEPSRRSPAIRLVPSLSRAYLERPEHLLGAL
jgi:hypothetical protein